jgi:hypothetical protein
MVFDTQRVTDVVEQFPGFGLFGHRAPSSWLQDQKCWCILAAVYKRWYFSPNRGSIPIIPSLFPSAVSSEDKEPQKPPERGFLSKQDWPKSPTGVYWAIIRAIHKLGVHILPSISRSVLEVSCCRTQCRWVRIPVKSSTSSGDAVHPSERSDASMNIIPSSGRHGQGRVDLAT